MKVNIFSWFGLTVKRFSLILLIETYKGDIRMSPNLSIKQINRNQIYRYIYKNKKVSQQEICSDLALSMPTVNQNLSVLREMGLIEEQGTFESTGGRKAKAICCVADARLSMGIDITNNHVSLVAIDMEANVLHYNRIRHRYVDSIFYYTTLGKLIRSFMQRNRIDQDKILGLGISLPAVVSEDHKTVHYGKAMRLPENLYERLAPHIPLPFLLFNDANSGGFAQWWDSEQDNAILYLSLNSCVGGAIVRNHQVYRGDNQKSCEFGHITLVPDGAPCFCGQKGCLNAYCSANRLSDLAGGKMSLFFDGVREGREPYVSAFQEYMEYLSMAVNNLRMCYDCDIVLGGYVGSYMTDYLREFRHMVAKKNPFVEPQPYIFTCKYKFETAAIGAALHYVDRFIRCI